MKNFFLKSRILEKNLKIDKTIQSFINSISKSFSKKINISNKSPNRLFDANSISFSKNQLKNFSKINYTYDTRDFLSKTSEYENQIEDSNKHYQYSENLIKGYATCEATEKYSKRNVDEVHKEHFRKLYNSNIKISSIGIGTYIGAPDDINDFYIYNAVKSCVLSGSVNIIDTAINYRYMKSEKAIGKALNALKNKYEVDREELFICSKIGYVPEDAEKGRRSHSFVQELVEEKKIEIEDVIFDEKNRPIHCMHPEYLKQQMEKSLNNLGLETLDVMYLHNVVESQGAILTPELFEKRITKAFEFMVSYLILFFYPNNKIYNKKTQIFVI